MALIEKIKAVADAIRNKTGYPSTMTIDEMPDLIDMIESGTTMYSDNTYIVVDEAGNEIPAVLTEEEVKLTASAATDIRAGTTAVTDEGVVTGEKEIPAYYTSEGVAAISAGSSLVLYSPYFDFTKLQAIICTFNSSIDDSTAAEKVVINDNVYAVNSTASIATLSKDASIQAVKFGITNSSDTLCLIRYFMFKEEP